MRAALISGVFLFLFTACGGGGGTDPAPGPDTTEPGIDTQGEDMVVTPDSRVEPEVFVPPEGCVEDAECMDGNPCTSELCVDGECEYQDATGPCDDGDPCTDDDQCVAGDCQGTAKDCDDGDDCTEDDCEDGECTHDLLKTPACSVMVNIYAPQRGTTLWDDKVVDVTGLVTAQGHTIVEASLNGHPINVDAAGDFQAITEAVVGLNLIEIKVKDDKGRSGRGLRAYLYGEGIRPPGTPAQINEIAAASLVWLDQEVLDDDDTSDLDDLATLAWTMLSNYDLNQFIPHPLFHEGQEPSIGWCEWDVDVDNVQYDVGPLDLVAVDGGLALSGSLTNLSADISAVADWCPDAIGYVYADDVSIDAEFSISLGEDGAFDLDLVSVDVSIQGISVDIVEGTGAYFDWLVNWFDETISDLIEENLETWLPESLIPMLDDLLTQFTSYDMEIPIPAIPGAGAGTPLALSVWPSAVDFIPGGVYLDLDVGVATQKLVGHTAPGSILRDDCEGQDPGLFSLPAQDAVEASLAEDLVNQLLFALWWGGHMNVTLTNEVLGPLIQDYGMTAMVLKVDPYLPPVITTCPSETGAELQLGGLNLWASFDLEGGDAGEIELFANLRVAAEPVLSLGDDGLNHVGIHVLGVEDIAVDVVSSSGVVDGLDGLVEQMIQVAVVDFLIGSWLSDFVQGYPIPAVDLGAFVPGVPTGSEVSFDFETLVPVKGYWLGGGKVVNP